MPYDSLLFLSFSKFKEMKRDIKKIQIKAW